MFFAFASFGSVLPHFLFGDRLYDNSNLLAPIGQNNQITLSPDISAMLIQQPPNISSHDIVHLNLCLATDTAHNFTTFVG